MLYSKTKTVPDGDMCWTIATLEHGPVVEMHLYSIGNSKLAYVYGGHTTALTCDIEYAQYDFHKRPIKYTLVKGINGFEELVELPQGTAASRYYQLQARLALEKSGDEVDSFYALLMAEYHMDAAPRHEIESKYKAAQPQQQPIPCAPAKDKVITASITDAEEFKAWLEFKALKTGGVL